MTTIAQRVKSAWHALTQPQRKAVQQSMVLWPKWREGQATWEMVDLSSYIEEGFNLNAIIYSAIMYKVRSAASAQLRAYVGDRDQKEPAPPQHPLARLLDRPNTHQSFLELDGELRVYYNLFGNAYVWFKRDRGNRGYPTEMRSLRPDWVRHLYRDQELKGFMFKPPGVSEDDAPRLLREDVMHVRMPNPGDPFAGMGKGLSPLSPLSQSGDVDNAATAYLKQFFDYGAMPPGLLTFDVPMSDDDVTTARTRWMEIYGGSRNWTDTAVLDQGGKYQRLGLTFAELDMKGLDGRNESRIAMPFGVPLTLIESRPDIVQSTYSNKEQDRVMFWQDTLLPELRAFEVEWLFYLHGDDGAFPAYDFSSVPALESARAARTTRLLEAARGGLVTRAEYKEAEGLPFDDSDNVYLLPISAVPIPVGAPAEPSAPAPSDSEGERANSEDDGTQRGKARPTKAHALTQEAKQRVWKTIDATATSYEDAAMEAARQAFERDRREVRAIISAGHKSALQGKATIAWQDVLLPVLDYFKMGSPEHWREVFAPVFEAVVVAQGTQLNATFGMTFDVRNLMGEDWFQSYQLQFADPIDQTSAEAMTELFGQAFAQGASVPEMEKSLDLLFRQWIDGDVTGEEAERTLFAELRLPPYRLETIARTETMRMSNAGAAALYKDWGVHQKEWLATNDLRTRDTHRQANGQVVEIDGTFDVGGAALRQPGDPRGPLEETINCRCTVLPVFGGGL
jgi:HK97 family phage portal protein